MKDLKEILTTDFLDKLKEAARQYGWSGDYVEVGEFVKWCYNEAGIEIKYEDLEPYDDYTP